METYVGVSLEAMMFNHDVAAPILYSNSSGATLAPVGSETRSLQAAKIAFDIGCELRALHGAGWFYNDLKPSNIAIQAFGDDPLEIRATLVDFESMSTLNGHLPTIRTDDCYRKLEDYSGTQEMSAQAFDMGCFTLAIASLVSSKPIAELTSGDIDAVQGICGGVFQVNNEGALESQSMTPKVLKGIAEVCHLKEADMGENLGTTRVAENRLGYLDLSDLRRINQTPEFVLESMRYQIAVAFHAIWRDASLSRNAVAVEFENQDKDLREQGLAQAKSVLSYLGTLGYGLVPIGSGSDRAAIAQFPENVIISLARKEHERWMEMHLALGYRYQERDENGMRQEKCNEHLLKWEDLKKIDSEGRPIQVEGNSVADLKMTRAKKVVVWAEGLVDVLKRVAHLAVVRVSRG